MKNVTSLAEQYRIDLSLDFQQLTSAEVDRVIAAADSVSYRKPRGATGSRARYFFAHLQRAAK